MKRPWLGALLILSLIGLGGWLLWQRPAEQVRAGVVGLAAEYSAQAENLNRTGDSPAALSEGFDRADAPRRFTFPSDFGPQPDFLTEWWYYTGNLAGEDGRRFGYQLTFFRRAAEPPAERRERESDWAVEQVYLAHFTMTDVSSNRFRAFERLERGAAGLAGAEIDPTFSVWLHDWSVEETADGQYRLRARAGEVDLDLTLTDTKGPVLQGENGLSQKGPLLGNASYYFSQTRLQTEGTVMVEGRPYPVTGTSWMDREISTSALSEGQVGWDWFALQLDDGSELMVYKIRREDGSADPYSSGLFVAPDGSTQLLKIEDYSIEETATWRSPRTGGEYPSHWVVTVPSLNLSLNIEPLIPDQELALSYSYWEGAVRITGEREGRSVSGFGYVELTGYAEALEGV